MKFVSSVSLTVLTVTFLLVPTLFADIPHRINYQGRLTDEVGNPVDGSHSFTFAIYTDSTGGDSLWAETHSGIPVSNGLFNVVLGSVVPIGSAVFAAQPRWLGMRVDSGTEAARTQIVAVAYAYRAKHADTAQYSLKAGGGGWTDKGSYVRLISPEDLVAIGKEVPEYRLDVLSAATAVRGLTTGGGAHAGVYGRSESDGLGVSGTSTSGRGVYGASVSGFGGYFLGPKNYFSGRVGIGTESPPYKLTVNGEISIASGDVSKYHINYYDGGLNFAETGVQDRRIHISDGGNVGIGTANPGAKLGVNGDLKVTGAFRGDISSASGSTGAPFPRPAYDSDWQTIGQGEGKWFTHNIGGDPDNYVVDLTMKYGPDDNRHIYGLGLNETEVGDVWGCFYQMLSNTAIRVYRGTDDNLATQVRVRIWVIE